MKDQQDHVAHEVRETCEILSLQGLKDILGSFKSGSEDDVARERRERIEVITSQLELHELQEELLCRLWSDRAGFMLPRRADVDPALVIAPTDEVEAALEAAMADFQRHDTDSPSQGARCLGALRVNTPICLRAAGGSKASSDHRANR